MDYLNHLPVESLFDDLFAFYGKLDVDGVIKELGGKVFEDIGTNSSLFLGQEFVDLPFWQTNFTNIENFRYSLQASRNGETSETIILFVSDKDQSRFVELKLIPINNEEGIISEIFFCTTDITKAEEEKNFFKTRCDEYLFAAENARVGLWFWDLGKSDIYSTPMCRTLLDITSEGDEIPPAEFVHAIHPDDLWMIEEALAKSRMDDNEYAVDCRVVRSDGNIRWVHARGKTIFDENQKPKTMTGSLREITDQKMASEELNIVYEREKNARAEAVEANRAKDNFLAVISHELRSSLNSILGWTQILSTRKLGETEQAKALQTIERSARSQAKLIEDLVDSARIRSGKLKLELFPVDIVEIVRRVINSQKPAIDDKNIDLHYSFNVKKVEVYGDTDRLSQVFTNLLTNAIKFTDDPGKISIDLSFDSNETVTIVIEDNGQGIAPENLPTVFEQFEQGSSKKAGRFSGLGLGLSIAKILIEKHDGTIKAESAGLGLGAKFTVVLPAISIQSIVDISEQNENEKDTKAGILDGIKILIVEDDEDSREVLEIFLSELNASVESCSSARDAMNILNRSGRDLPDVIVSDLGMPDEDGYFLIKKIRSDPRFSEIPAIALSAFTALSSKTLAFDSGYQTYHTKPFDPDLLAEEIIGHVKDKNNNR
ncbi:MAG: ATP-binding protein [Pyrinomonadaceae bacterium]